MSSTTSRRAFLKNSALTTAALAATQVARAARAADSPAEAPVLGFIGVRGRGGDLAEYFLKIGGNRIAYVCDVDQRAVDKVVSAVGGQQNHTPQGVADMRRIFEDPAVDGVVIATPDHWHAPAAIMACAAGKHVYVEKPASHNPREGELMIEAARKYNRVVQLGTQRRSMPVVIEAIERLRAGEIGRVALARGWVSNSRHSIGHGQPAPVPDWLDYELWQGPAPARPYQDNLIHYNWHWFWHWGTGELGNNGIHALDVCRWGLGVDYPKRVTAGGGKYIYTDDDQETPDTHAVTWDFGDKSITWEGCTWHRRGIEDSSYGSVFYGDKGAIVIGSDEFKMYDADNKLVAEKKGLGGQDPHFQNFLECVRSGERPHADIEEGHKGTLLCHLGNIAYRTGRTIHCDPANGHIQDDAESAALWSREYQPGWEPKV